MAVPSPVRSVSVAGVSSFGIWRGGPGTWTASASELEVFSGAGAIVFAPTDVVAVEGIHGGDGRVFALQLRHTRLDAPESIVLSAGEAAAAFLVQLADIGFVPQAKVEEIPRRPGLAVRPSFAVGSVALIYGVAFFGQSDDEPGHLSRFAEAFVVVFVFGGAIATLVSKRLQRLVTNDGRHFNEIRHGFQLFAFMGAIFLPVALALLAFR